MAKIVPRVISMKLTERIQSVSPYCVWGDLGVLLTGENTPAQFLGAQQV